MYQKLIKYKFICWHTSASHANQSYFSDQLKGLLFALCSLYYLHQGVYVTIVVCSPVCLSVRNFAQKLPNGFA